MNARCLLACLLALVFGLAGTAAAQPIQPPRPATDFERLIYLPYKNLKAVLDNEKATVFIPYGQFLKLWEAYRPQGPDGKPPVGAVLTEAKYTGTVEKDTAKVTAELTIRVLGKPWVELPVEFGDAAIGKITSPDNKVLLQATGNGKYTFLLPEAGEHKVQLDLVARVHASPDGRSLELAVPPASVTTVDLTVPAADQAVELLGSDTGKPALTTPAAAAMGATHVTAQLGATGKIVARWRPRISTAPVMELLASVQSLQDIRVADGLVHTHATLTWQVQRGQLDQLRVLVPTSHRVLDVTSPSLKSWKATTEEKQQVLVVDLLSSDAKTVTLEIHSERPAPEESFAVAGIAEDGTVHGIHATGGVRETGLIVLGQAADLTLAVEKTSGVVRVEAAEAPEALRRPEAQVYRYYSPKFDLQVQAKPVAPRILVDNTTTLTFTDDELRLDAALAYTVERAGVFELRLNVPEGLVIDRVDSPQMKEFQAPEGQNVLIVSLKERTQGTLSLAVSAHRPFDPASMDALPLPTLEPVNVERETGSIRVLAPESIEVIVDDKGLQGAQPSPDAANQANLPPAMRLASAWTYTRRPLAIPVTTSRRPTRLSASVGTVINFGQDVVDVTTTVNFHVEYAGVDTFRVALPKAVAETVQIESGNPGAMPIKQKQQADAENDWVVWTVVFQRELSGTVPLIVRYNVKPAKEQATSKLTVSPVRVLPALGDNDAEIPLAGLTGELTLQKDRSLSITAEAKELEPIDVRDLRTLPQDGYLAYRWYRQPEQFNQPLEVSLTATLHEIQKVADTIVMKAAHEAVVTEDPAVLYRTRFLLQTSERQRLALNLPKDAELLDTQVAGRKVELERRGDAQGDWQPFFINVGRTSKSEEPFAIALIFRAPFRSPPLEGNVGGTMKLYFPQIVHDATSVPVLQMRVAVWAPKEYHLVGKPDGFTPTYTAWFDPRPWEALMQGVRSSTSDTSDMDNWFGATTASFVTFLPAGHAFTYEKLGAGDSLTVNYWAMVPATWVASITLLLVGLVLSFTSWENRLSIALILAFVAVLFALYDYNLTLHALSAARWGLIAVAVLWIVRGVRRPKTSDVDFRTRGAPIAAVIPPPGVFDKP